MTADTMIRILIRIMLRFSSYQIAPIFHILKSTSLVFSHWLYQLQYSKPNTIKIELYPAL